jgi:hypothetical protein
MQPRFQRRVEDFTCEQCGTAVVGDGYTNHCPKCLWSKHVDIMPGDRAADCGGMMEPIAIEGSTGKGYRIRHRCKKCGHEKMNDANAADSPDALVALAKRGETV